MFRILQIYNRVSYFKSFFFGRDIYRERVVRFKNKFSLRFDDSELVQVGYQFVYRDFNLVNIYQYLFKLILFWNEFVYQITKKDFVLEQIWKSF